MLPRLKCFHSSLISSLKSHVVFIFCLFYLSANFSFAQSDNISEQIERLEDFFNVKFSYVDSNILKLEFPDGEITYRIIGDYKPLKHSYKQTYSPTYDSTIIDLTTIDTALYSDKYKFWQEVLIANDPYLVIGDINNNKRPEIYGYIKDYTIERGDVIVKEMNEQGTFDSLFSYDNTLWARSIYDIDKDAKLELHLFSSELDTTISTYIKKQVYYTQPEKDSLATKLKFIFSPFHNVSNQKDHRYGDFDNDAFTDLFFISSSEQGMFIYEYNPLSNNFDSVYVFNFDSLDIDFDGTVVGDFDSDGKQEIITGGAVGNVVVVENNGNNSYYQSWLGSVGAEAAYFSTSTNDVDKNGKKEVWIGGYSVSNGQSVTRFTIFESHSDNNYAIVGKVDLVGAGGLFLANIQTVDIDKDGTDEIFMCIGDIIVILKFSGSINHQKYEVFYVKKNDFTVTNFSYSGAIMYDLDGDKREEFLINVYHDPPEPNYARIINVIYKPTFLTEMKETNYLKPTDFYLGAFPNPFNSEIEINFSLVKQSDIELSVFNILGEKVNVLINSELTNGEHKEHWDARTENGIALPSGIYFIKLTDGIISKTIKAVLLK